MNGGSITAQTVEQVRTAILDARSDGASLEIRGGASVLARLPRGEEAVLSVAGLDGILAHDTEDLTVTVRAGTSLAELTEVLAAAGQECPIEPVGGAGSTVGGRLATGLAGPRQLGAGRVRDWLLRVRFVTGTGQLATAGGVTVKDVTGYDLCRLTCGAWGTLGVITEATLKLRPLARHREWYATAGPREDLDAVLYRPAAVLRTAERTHVLLEGHPDDAAEQATLAGLLPHDPPPFPSAARAAVDPALLATLVVRLGRRLDWVAQDGVGVCHLGGTPEALAEARRTVEHLGGSLLVLAPDAGLPAFGPPRSSVLGERVRAALDPDRVLAPWRWYR